MFDNLCFFFLFLNFCQCFSAERYLYTPVSAWTTFQDKTKKLLKENNSGLKLLLDSFIAADKNDDNLFHERLENKV
jgi:hypothetical protein